MAEATNIAWADSTFNPWIGCTKISPACDHCYAERLASRMAVAWGTGSPRKRTAPSNWAQVDRWNSGSFVECMECGWRGDVKAAKKREPGAGWHPKPGGLVSHCPGCGEPTLKTARRRVFCASLADVFDNEVDPLWRRDLFALIARTSNLDWLLLTKRIGNAEQMIAEARDALWDVDGGAPNPGSLPDWPWSNVWLGATIANQDEANRDIPKLLGTPAALRFVSIEPMLGPIHMRDFLYRPPSGNSMSGWVHPIDWVIVGGESGAGARPMHPDWVRDLRDQCTMAGTPLLLKQWGAWVPSPDFQKDDASAARVRIDLSLGRRMYSTRDQHALALVDGRTHLAFPESRA